LKVLIPQTTLIKHSLVLSHYLDDKKRRYAEKMANAHLRSTGMGEYTPKGNNYAKLPLKGGTADLGESPSSRWRLKSREDDEFDF